MDSPESKARSWRVIIALFAALFISAATTAQAAHSCALTTPSHKPAAQTAETSQAKDVHCLLCAGYHVQALPSARPLLQPPLSDAAMPAAALISRNSAATCFSLYIRPPPAN